MNTLGSALHAICDGVLVGFPLGVLLGVLLWPARVSGVDFRQWFWDSTKPSELNDDSWIGLMRGAAHVLFGSAMLSLAIASIWLWLTCPPNHASELYLFADCLGFWELLCDLLGIGVGIVAAQIVAEVAWQVGLSWVPALPARVLARSPLRTRGPATVPTTGRRLIICCDGTWNWPDPTRETNVVRLARAIKSQTRLTSGKTVSQIVHYHLGVGTGNFIDRIVGGGAGVGLSNSVKACYGFLVDNYTPDDEILLFGFSRGSYVVRSVAGLVGRVGILQKREMDNFIDVWDCYTGYVPDDSNQRAKLDCLAPERHQNVSIQCVGVWDTVGALGIPGTRFCANAFAFHQTELGKHVRHAFQALAIDERRGNFQAAVWVPNPNAPSDQVLEQVWFPGVHSNIGGGYKDHGLSDTTLLWMVSQILEYDLLDVDIQFIGETLDRSEPYPTGMLRNSRTFGWRLFGCPVPRPVGTTSSYSSIHVSAWDRAASADPILRTDIYRRERRRQWLKPLNFARFDRSRFETRYAVTVRDKPRPPPRQYSSKLSFCDKLMKLIGGV